MIKPAQLFVKELKIKFWEIAFVKRYMFVNDGYSEEYSPSNSSWNEHEFVSVSSKNEVLGYIRYGINQRSGVASGLCAINFSKSIIFTRDLFQAIDDIFCKYKYNKLKFGVYIGNPIELTYDRLIKKYGGRLVGINIREAKLIDGNWYDHKHYEIHCENYLKNRNIAISRTEGKRYELPIGGAHA